MNDVLFISLDSCRYDTFRASYRRGALPHLASLGPLHKAMAPSHFTYGSHAAFWMGFTPGVQGSSAPLLNPKVLKLFRLGHGQRQQDQGDDALGFALEGANVIDGFRRKGYSTIGSGAVGWFDTATATGSVLAQPFDRFQFAGDCWSLHRQLAWINDRLQELPPDQPCFLFLNVGETHLPYWHEGADWPRWPSPCEPFGGSSCSARQSRRRQRACLEWVDQQLAPLLQRFSAGTVMVCADHGDCWGENGLWAHGISHPATLTVPLILRVRGEPVHA
ncbi:alkaline phosphatase and sulfatase ALP-like protein superfamily [Synechococcus sp. PROS-7-1]|uniref:sulfatase-like hydrolase/transferase n=1 Tax=Synechococcus sp. PROS-7-1 TaxID=1442556 RepID=UPI0016477998|nr:sulfatase-like hydrolase/transferase [Synechococcus sp. PROS-7-1]QNI83992.1 alkaline phosphatase and sulfatase ALP-like protein superfamily [Synechococcus sp. PROS-7-1]